MTDYPVNEQDQKKAIAAQEKFCKRKKCEHGIDVDDLCSQCVEDAEIEDIENNELAIEFAARTTIKDTKSVIETLIKQNHVSSRAIEFLHNASWHLTQALKITDKTKGDKR